MGEVHRGKGRGRGHYAQQYVFIDDIREEMEELLEELWDEPYPVKKAKQIRWGNAVTETDADMLALLQPLAEDIIPVNEAARVTKKQQKAQNKAKAKAQSKQSAGKKSSVPDYIKQSVLTVGDRATLTVHHGPYKGSHTVNIVKQEEKGWQIKHEKDGFMEIVKQRDINSGKLSLSVLGAKPKARDYATQGYQ